MGDQTCNETERLAKDLFDQLTGRVSLPFQPGEHQRIAVKVIDQRGNEVMRVVGA